MENKYIAYSYLSIKTLIMNKSILFGFMFNLIIALIVTVYLIVFQPEIPTLSLSSASNTLSNALGVLNIIVIIIVFFLFSSVATMMQSVIDDRDSKVSEIINTSISENHYLFGKIVTSFVLIVVTVLNALLAIVIAGIVFSIFNPYDFGIYADFIKPFVTSMNVESVMFLIGCFGICLLMIITSILFTLGVSIKANSSVDAFPVSLLILTPYFFLFGLLIFLPTDSSDLWVSISSTVMFIPVFSPIFILMFVLLEGFSMLAFLAIAISIIYLVILFKGVTNVYSFAFYANEKLSIKQLLSLSVKGKTR